MLAVGTKKFWKHCPSPCFSLALPYNFAISSYSGADIAIGVPFAGEDRRGKVLIYNGVSTGLNPNPSQVLSGMWASQSVPAGFGFTLRGDSDIDKNDYPGKILSQERGFHLPFLWKKHNF